MSNSIVLLKNLLRSTSQWNQYRHTRDRKKKGRIIGNFIGYSVLYLMLMAYCVSSCIGYGKIGIAEVIPILCAITISLMSFLLTLFKTNGYLYNFKEYDMLMSLPFKPATVAGCKFLYMYVKSLLWNLSISLAMLIGYALYAKPAVSAIPAWIVLSFFLPLIPMLAAAFLGFLIAKISAGFKKKSIIQTVLSFLVVLFVFALRFIVEAVGRSGRIELVLTETSAYIKDIAALYPPAAWFSRAAAEGDLLYMLLLAGVSIALFEIVFLLVGRNYSSINSKLKSHAAAGKFSMTAQKSRSIYNAIAYKEFRRMTGSSVYMTNVGMGELMALILGIVILFVDVDQLLGKMFNGVSLTKEMLYPAIPLVVHFIVGMVATTVVSPSLEGKNFWIVRSLPISGKQLYQGKMLFNMYLMVPFSLFATICICISAAAPLLTGILCVTLSFCLCALSTAWGCVCGIRHMKLEWENEIEVIKQGAAVMIYLFPNMLVSIGLIVLSVFLGTKIDRNIILAVLIALVSILAAFCYRRACSLAEK